MLSSDHLKTNVKLLVLIHLYLLYNKIIIMYLTEAFDSKRLSADKIRVYRNMRKTSVFEIIEKNN